MQRTKDTRKRPATLNIKVPVDLREEMANWATAHERSMHGEIVWALRTYLRAQNAEDTGAA
jgi:hypothetical protein